MTRNDDRREDSTARNDNGGEGSNSGENSIPMEAYRYEDGSITYPGHPRGPNGDKPVGTVDLSEHTAEVLTWTTSHATPPGVREPNHLAIVEFDIDDQPVRALCQLTTGDVSIGDDVRPVYCEQLRDPDAGVREPASQSWDGYRFEPVE